MAQDPIFGFLERPPDTSIGFTTPGDVSNWHDYFLRQRAFIAEIENVVNNFIGGAPLVIEDEGIPVSTDTHLINFQGAGVTATGTVNATLVTIPGGAPPLITKDEGTILTLTTASLDFIGTGVTATVVGNDVTVSIPGASGGGVAEFFWGSQRDGAVTLDGVSAVPGFVRAGNLYTASRNTHHTTLTINAGVRMSGGGYRQYGLLLVNNGHIDGDGVSAINQAGGAQLHTGFYVGTNGGGAVGGGVGAQNGTDLPILAGLAGGRGGRGGNSGGFFGGVVTPETYLVDNAFVTAGGLDELYTFGLALIHGAYSLGTGGTVNRFNGGGGGSGGASIAGSQGGGGGTGGEVLSLYFKVISGTGTITANGANGGNGTGGTNGGAGGGAGGGGLIQFATTTPGVQVAMGMTVTPGTAGVSQGVATAPTAAAVGNIVEYLFS